MTLDASNYYISYPAEKEDERLDFNYNHPIYREMESRIRQLGSCYELNEIIRAAGLTNGVEIRNFVEKEEGNPYLRVSDFRDVGVSLENVAYVSASIDDLAKDIGLENGDLLVTRSGTLGLVVTVDDIFPKSLIISSDIIRVRLKSRIGSVRIVPKYVEVYLRTSLGQYQFRRIDHGSSIPKINQPSLSSISVLIPTADKQQRIVNAFNSALKQYCNRLHTSRELIAHAFEKLLDELGVELVDEKADYYYSWFDELNDRLSYGTYHPSVEQLRTSLDNSKHGSRTLGQLIELRYDTIEPTKQPEEEYLYIGLEDIERNTGSLSNVRRMRGQDISSKSNVFRKGQLMFAGLRPYLNKCFILEHHDDAIGSAELFVCDPKEGVSLKYLKWFLLSDATLRQTEWILSGASYPRLDESDFLNLKVVIPEEYEEQVRISKAVDVEMRNAETEKQEAEKKWEAAMNSLEGMIRDAVRRGR
ncbi:MAG: restriction endonuclease subunit S [Thermoplasmata archaeon]|nr:restriction endonuclease subunit S [Thermoplasmata archaeon]